MGALVDLLLQTTDPVTALLLIGIYLRLREVRDNLRQDLAETRGRVERLEAELLESTGS
jgi:hypothetical protein